METVASIGAERPNPGPASAPVTEIYPGAASQPPVVNGIRTAEPAPAQSGPGAHRDSNGRPVGIDRRRRNLGSELGMATAEYAIATLAAVGFAGLLVVILRSEEVRGFLLAIIRSALSLQ
ncbi:DUF4244 domain-containing protein [Pseudarthrobacter sp. P1]|uniref:DUF4244 domain-containing protein n=1 Tax=Pseudarthrobacter sp. P1 TaxID=3418418 RepID=UPI003CEFF194